MGMLGEMFGSEDSYDEKEYPPTENYNEVLALGRYTSEIEETLAGYKIYQKKYVVKKTIFKIVLFVLALASSIYMYIINDYNNVNMLIILIALFLGIYTIIEPINHKKSLKKALEQNGNTEYEVEITLDTAKISTVLTEEQKKQIRADVQKEIEENPDEKIDEYNGENPSTVIHLDNPMVDFVNAEKYFIIIVKKSCVFIIPKRSFTEQQINTVLDKLPEKMGIKFKMI